MAFQNNVDAARHSFQGLLNKDLGIQPMASLYLKDTFDSIAVKRQASLNRAKPRVVINSTLGMHWVSAFLCCRAKRKVHAAVAPSSHPNTSSGFILAPFCILMAVITPAIGQNADFNSEPLFKIK